MADKYKWYAEKDGKTLQGTELEIQEWTGLSEYQIYHYLRSGKRCKGWFLYRETIDYYGGIYDVVDDDNEIVFTGNVGQIERHFGYKKLKIKDYLDKKYRLGKKYRVFRHDEFDKPQYHQNTIDVATMLKIYGNTGTSARTLERTLKELKQMGIRVYAERSVHWKDWYVLTRRDNAEARSQSI